MTAKSKDHDAARVRAAQACEALELWATVPRSAYVAAAWAAGEHNVSELARAARVGRDTIYRDLHDQGIDPQAGSQIESPPKMGADQYRQLLIYKQALTEQLRAEMAGQNPPVDYWVIVYHGPHGRAKCITIQMQLGWTHDQVLQWVKPWGLSDSTQRAFGPFTSEKEANRLQYDSRLWHLDSENRHYVHTSLETLYPD